eukprot:1253675-Prymnesium_polylepis.1
MRNTPKVLASWSQSDALDETRDGRCGIRHLPETCSHLAPNPGNISKMLARRNTHRPHIKVVQRWRCAQGRVPHPDDVRAQCRA